MIDRHLTHHTGLLSPLIDYWRSYVVGKCLRTSNQVLDIGCGPGLLIPHLPASCDYLGLEIDANLVEQNRVRFPGRRFLTGNVFDDPTLLTNNTFDAIALAAVLEHLENPAHALRRLSGLLQINGRLVATTPSPWGLSVHEKLSALGLASHDAADDHKSSVDLQNMAPLLEGTGLVLERAETFEWGLNQLFVLRKDG